MLPKATLVNKVADCPISKGAASRSYRKPYVVRKSREKWSSEEHGRFVEAVSRFGRDWSAIVHFVSTRSVAQVRSHAQKYFLKLQHQGKADAVPPPRPKRRSTRPYPVQQQRTAFSGGHSLAGSLQSLPSGTSQDFGHEDSCGGHESNDSSANTNHSHHDDSSETSVQMPSVQNLSSTLQHSVPAVHAQASLVHQLPPAAQVPLTKGDCSTAPSAATYSDVARLYKALDVVLQRPVDHTGHEHHGYTVQRAMLVAKLNHLKSQLDSSCCGSNMDHTVMACQPAACSAAPALAFGQVPMQPCGRDAPDLQQHPYPQSCSHASQQIQLPPLSTASFSSPAQWSADQPVNAPLHTQEFLQYPVSSAYAEAAVERLRSASAPSQRPLNYSLGDTCTSSSMAPGASSECSTLPPWQRQQAINQSLASQMPAQATFPGLPSPVKVELDGAWNCQHGNLSQTLPDVIPPEAADDLHIPVPELPYACGLSAPQAQPAALIESSLEETCKMLRPPSFPCGLDLDDGHWSIDDSIMLGIEDANGSNDSSLADLDPSSWLQF